MLRIFENVGFEIHPVLVPTFFLTKFPRLKIQIFYLLRFLEEPYKIWRSLGLFNGFIAVNAVTEILRYNFSNFLKFFFFQTSNTYQLLKPTKCTAIILTILKY